MPYAQIGDLPEQVRDVLPHYAQEIYRAAFNHAWDEYRDPDDRRGDASREETAHRVAWSTVKEQYEKNESSGKWRPKED